MKGEVPGSSLAEDTVEHEGVQVDVELETAPEPLDHRHRAGLALRDAVRPRGARVEGEQLAGIHAQHGAAQGVIPRQSVAQAIRQRQDSLAHRYLWQHLVDQIGGALGHPPSPAARTEAASLAREGHEALEGAVGAPKPGEAVGQHSTRKELAKLLLDEAGKPWPSLRSQTSRRKGSRCSRTTAWRTECSVSRG